MAGGTRSADKGSPARLVLHGVTIGAGIGGAFAAIAATIAFARGTDELAVMGLTLPRLVGGYLLAGTAAGLVVGALGRLAGKGLLHSCVVGASAGTLGLPLLVLALNGGHEWIERAPLVALFGALAGTLVAYEVRRWAAASDPE